MIKTNDDLVAMWRDIEKSGSMNSYVNQQMKAQGFTVKRSATDSMSKRELAAYKKDLKQEAAEKRKLKSNAWLAYKANHVVYLGDGIYWNDNNDVDKYDLENAEERAAENELPVMDDAADLANKLAISVADLRYLTYHREAATQIHYKRFTIPKRNGKERAIWAPMPKLKQAQHWVLHNVLGNLYVHGASHGFIRGRSIYSNALAHVDAKLVVKMDMQDFFPTISQPRVKGLFRKAGYRERIATLLSLLCTESPREVVEQNGKTYYIAMGPRCLPQGAPTSPAITNALCLRLDRRLMGMAEKYGWRYTRYADDMTFSFPDNSKKKAELSTLLFLAKKIVTDEGFTVHPEKTKITRKGRRQQITGLVVNGKDLPRVPRERKREIRAAIHNLQKGKPLREGESLESLQGYAAFVCMTDPELGHKLLAQLQAFQTVK